MKKNSVALVLGLIFGIGLSLSKMTDPQVVLGFFDVAGHFNPLLLFVFIGALATTLLGYKLVFRRSQPLIADNFHIPIITLIDNKLVIGASLFGIGWGLSGYCPAPVLGVLVINQLEFLIFVTPMILAFYLVKKVFV